VQLVELLVIMVLIEHIFLLHQVLLQLLRDQGKLSILLLPVVAAQDLVTQVLVAVAVVLVVW
jgi:hypothetical protein